MKYNFHNSTINQIITSSTMQSKLDNMEKSYKWHFAALFALICLAGYIDQACIFTK